MRLQTACILLEVSFVYGTAEEILAARAAGSSSTPWKRGWAGARFHEIKGHLWGTTFDVPRDAGGDGASIHPSDVPLGTSAQRPTDHLGRFYVAEHSGTAIATAGHLHPNGRKVVIANVGPAGSSPLPDGTPSCEANLDGDGFPGTTLLVSDKIERVPEAFPFSEDYQMGLRKFGWRAPVRAGNPITQFGVHCNLEHAPYGAMRYAGFYVAKAQAQDPRPLDAQGKAICSLQDTRSHFVRDAPGDPEPWNPLRSMLNHDLEPLLPHCGVAFEGTAFPACNRPVQQRSPGMWADVVHIAGFAYLPGDFALGGSLGNPPRVLEGRSIRFVSDDALGVRHTVTSCAWPCNGPYVANDPHPTAPSTAASWGTMTP